MPPRGGGTAQCDAAAAKVKWIKDFIDQLTADLTTAGEILYVVNLLLDFLDLLAPEFAILLDLITSVASSLATLGGAAISAALTSTEYDLLTCIFFCNSASDGTVSASQLSQTMSDVTAQLNTTAALVINEILTLQGNVGLTNAGTLFTITGDCSSCTCSGWTYEWDFRSSNGGWFPRSIDEAIYVGGTGWIANCATSPSSIRLVIQYNIPTAPAIQIDKFEVDLDYVQGSNSGTDPRKVTMREFDANNGGGSTLATLVNPTTPPLATGSYTEVLTSTQTPHSVEFNVWCSQTFCDGSAVAKKARFKGTGTPPSALTGGNFI